ALDGAELAEVKDEAPSRPGELRVAEKQGLQHRGVDEIRVGDRDDDPVTLGRRRGQVRRQRARGREGVLADEGDRHHTVGFAEPDVARQTRPRSPVAVPRPSASRPEFLPGLKVARVSRDRNESSFGSPYLSYGVRALATPPSFGGAARSAGARS